MDTKNKIKNLPNSFVRFCVSEESVKFDDDVQVNQLIQQYIKNQVAEAKRQGARDAFEQLDAELKKIASHYMALVTKIVDFVRMVVKERGPKAEISLLESRTNFDFFTQEIKILFIIDSNLEEEFLFSSILSKTEQEVLEIENTDSQLTYINKRGNKIDQETIYNDYPFVRNEKATS